MGRENGPVSGRSIMRQCPCTASPSRAAEGNVFDGAMDCIIPADLTSRLARAFPNGAAPNSFCARTFTACPRPGASARVGRGGGTWPGSETARFVASVTTQWTQPDARAVVFRIAPAPGTPAGPCPAGRRHGKAVRRGHARQNGLALGGRQHPADGQKRVHDGAARTGEAMIRKR